MLPAAFRGSPLRFDAGLERLEGYGLEKLERELLELVLDLGHPEAVGNRGVDIQRLLGDARAAILGHVLQRAHVVQTVRQLDEDDPDVVHHREQHLAEVFRLALLGG
jgi:hypothetical protein